jgi:hypothetical protein
MEWPPPAPVSAGAGCASCATPTKVCVSSQGRSLSLPASGKLQAQTLEGASHFFLDLYADADADADAIDAFHKRKVTASR